MLSPAIAQRSRESSICADMSRQARATRRPCERWKRATMPSTSDLPQLGRAASTETPGNRPRVTLSRPANPQDIPSALLLPAAASSQSCTVSWRTSNVGFSRASLSSRTISVSSCIASAITDLSSPESERARCMSRVPSEIVRRSAHCERNSPIWYS